MADLPNAVNDAIDAVKFPPTIAPAPENTLATKIEEIPDFDKFLDPADYKAEITYAYFCTREPEGRDKSFLSILKEYTTYGDFMEVDPSSLPSFGRRNVLIILPDLLRSTKDHEAAPENDPNTGDPRTDWFYKSLLYVFAYDPAVDSDTTYEIDEEHQFEKLEDIIVGYSPSTIMDEDFIVGMSTKLKWCYYGSAMDCFYKDYEVGGVLRDRAVGQVLAHLKKTHGDPADREWFWSNWFSFDEPRSERLKKFLRAGAAGEDEPWQQQGPQ
jgi:hypothetical protein